MSYSKELMAAIEGREFEDAAALAADIVSLLSAAAIQELVTAEIENIQRNLTRDKEHAVFQAVAFPAGTVAAFDVGRVKFEQMREAFAPLFRSTFAVDGERVTWGRATEEQHLARIAALEKLSLGIQDTISRHRTAVEAIRAARVSCLEEIGQRKAARRELAAANA